MHRIAVLLSAVAIAGCTVGPDYRPRPTAELGVPTAYSIPAGQSGEDLTRWWQRFGDPDLARIVDQARVANTDLAQAVARLRQARESLVQSRAGLFPSVTGSAGYSRSENLRGGSSNLTLPDGTVTTIARGAGDSFSVGVDAQYQVGLFGEVRRTVEASRAEQDAARFDYAAVLVSVTGEVARNYMIARGTQAQIANARASLALQDENLEIAGFRVQAGLVSSLDVEQARSQRAQTAATIPQLQQQYDAAVARLGVLTGQAPGALRPDLAAPRPIPAGPASVGAGIPADVLRQRPDVRAAERALAAATARIGVAKAQLYPALAITGNIDTNATSLGNLGSAITGGLFAGLTQAIFNGGRLRSQVRGAEAAADLSLGQYRGTVLTALEDVENALTALRAAEERQRQFAIALEAARASALLGRSQYRTGLTDFTTLNQQELTLLSAQNGLTEAQTDRATALVQLYAALGGGWDESSIPDGRRSPASTGAR
jgi:NodT family efflux transporter outer membrane factor (OMF) lipoprotein